MRLAVLFALLLSAADACAATGCAALAAAPPATQPGHRPPPATGPAADAESASAEYVEYRSQPELGVITVQVGVVRGSRRVKAFAARGRELPQRDVFPMVDPPAAAASAAAGPAGAPKNGGDRPAVARRRGGAPGGRGKPDAGAGDPAKGNLAQPADGRRQIYRRREKVDGRRIDTVIVLDPPADRPASPAGKAPDRLPGEEGQGDDPADAWVARVLIRVDGRLKVAVTLGTSGEGDDELYVPRVTLYPEDGTLDILALSGEGEELTLPADWLSLDDPTLITDGSFFEDDPNPPGGGPYNL